MSADEIERALAGDDSIAPSSGFADAVRLAVAVSETEAPPLRFPWLRLALGMAACVIVAASLTLLAPRVAPPLIEAVPAHTVGPVLQSLGYVALALVLSFALLRLPRLLLRRD